MNDNLSVAQTAANDATPLTQLTIEAYMKAGKEIDKKLVNEIWTGYANAIHEWIIQTAKKAAKKANIEVPSVENPYIVVYINKGNYDPDDKKYKDFFEKNNFNKSPKGGWNKRIRQQEYNEWLNEEKNGKKVNDWILRAFDVKTIIADKQQEEK